MVRHLGLRGLPELCAPSPLPGSVRPETQFAVYNALTCPKKHLLYPDFGHEEIQAFDDQIILFYQGEVDL